MVAFLGLKQNACCANFGGLGTDCANLLYCPRDDHYTCWAAMVIVLPFVK